MSAGHRLPRSRVWIGGEFGYLLYGQETRKAPLSPTVPDIIVELDTDNQILLFNSRVRYEVGPGRFQPYVEGVAGLQRLWTATSIANQSSSSGDSGLSTTHLSDTVAAYGGGAGVANGELSFDVSRSRTDMFMVYVGYRW
jgi:hypothetical protein